MKNNLNLNKSRLDFNISQISNSIFQKFFNLVKKERENGGNQKS